MSRADTRRRRKKRLKKERIRGRRNFRCQVNEAARRLAGAGAMLDAETIDEGMKGGVG